MPQSARLPRHRRATSSKSATRALNPNTRLILFKPLPKGVVSCLAQDENHECDAQHAEDAHHRRMPVIGGKVTSAAAVREPRPITETRETALLGSRRCIFRLRSAHTQLRS